MMSLATDRLTPAGGVWTRRFGLLGLGFVLVLALALSLGFGSVSIPLRELFVVLSGGDPSRASWGHIVLDVRLPRALTAALAGAALGVGGLEMQTFFRNPLADPFLLGITSGAGLGVALVVLATGVSSAGIFGAVGFLGGAGLLGAASLGAALVLGAVMVIGSRVRHTVTLLIVGLMVGYATGAVVSVLLSFSLPEEIQAYVHWTFGSFGGVTWSQLRILGPVILAGLLWVYLLAKPLDALLLGETYARSLGLAVSRVRLWVIASASILAGTVTACCGPIAFVGVAVPHLCRALFDTSDHRLLVPATALMGSLVALLADLVARLPGAETALPLNAVTALLGAPIVLWIVLRRGRLRGTFAA